MGGQATTLASLLNSGAPSNAGAAPTNGNAQPQFDGQTAVPGYTLFKGKDGQSFYLKGENLSDADVTARVATLRNSSQTPEQKLSRTNANMALAMSGQQAQMSPDDRTQFESGRKAGTIAGGVQIATGAAGGLFTPGVQATQETSSLLGPEGQPITTEVLKQASSIAGKGIQAIKNALPAAATPDQAAKVAKILYHTGAGVSGLGGTAYLVWRELFGK